MDDRADIGFVDAHPERVGRDDDLRRAVHEPLLRGGALIAREPCVIDDRLFPELTSQEIGDHLASRPA